MSGRFQLSVLLLPIFALLFSNFLPTHAIKFTLQAHRYPQKKCLWNPAHENTLVIVTANIGPGAGQRTDIQIVDSSPQQNVYLRKQGIKAETRLAITTHAEGDVGVCFFNYLNDGELLCGVCSSLVFRLCGEC
jgi:p24 family protein delta-1